MTASKLVRVLICYWAFYGFVIVACSPDTPNCGLGGFYCHADHKCATGILPKCNYVDDCSDGEDERGCPACRSGKVCVRRDSDTGKPMFASCVDEAEACNGQQDCWWDYLSYADETDCDSCQDGAFHCARSRTCVKASWRCDYFTDCAQGEDEEGCGCEFRCDGGVVDTLGDFILPPRGPHHPNCIPQSSVCDGYKQCKDGQDERNCH